MSSTPGTTVGGEPHAAFPGWRWALVALGFPLAGYTGYLIAGRVDAVGAALLGGLITGAGIGAVQWYAADGALGRVAAWVVASGAGYGLGLAAGAAIVGYETGLADLAAMGALSGVVLGAAQGAALAAQGFRRLALVWAAAMPALLAIGWSVTTLGGIDVDRQFTVFGAFGAITFMLLSGLLLARYTAPPPAVG
jgi:hypothetical protein